MKITIEEAKKILYENGYCLIKITDDMNEKMDICAEGECNAESCIDCCCNVCVLNNL